VRRMPWLWRWMSRLWRMSRLWLQGLRLRRLRGRFGPIFWRLWRRLGRRLWCWRLLRIVGRLPLLLICGAPCLRGVQPNIPDKLIAQVKRQCRVLP
jgi:hypothetical protein